MNARRTAWDDTRLVITVALLCLMGLMVLYSASVASPHLFIKQLINFTVAIGCCLVIRTLPLHELFQMSWLLYAISIATLLLVFAFGYASNGAQRWLHLPLFTLQPSELIKITLPMVIAEFLFESPHNHSLWRSAALVMILTLLPALLIIKQPDLGTAISILMIGMFAIYFSGLPSRIIAALTLGAISSAPVMIHYLHDYQKKRLFSFLHPENDPLGSGYHLIQSKIAIGSGGIFGKGWLQGTQGHLNFLPEDHTDFILALLAEEFGLVGTLAVLALFTYWLWQCVILAWQCSVKKHSFFVLVCSFSLYFNALINIMMVNGLLPVVGIPLPFISYGGSTLLVNLLTLSIILSIAHFERGRYS